MRTRYLVALLAVLLGMAITGRVVYSANETAVYDVSGNQGTYSIIGVDEATGLETRLIKVNASGELVTNVTGASGTVSIALEDDFESENLSVAGNSGSGTGLNPSWAANSFTICNAPSNAAATSPAFIGLGETAANDVGFELIAGACWGKSGIEFATLTAYVDGGARATFTVSFGRVTP